MFVSVFSVITITYPGNTRVLGFYGSGFLYRLEMDK